MLFQNAKHTIYCIVVTHLSENGDGGNKELKSLIIDKNGIEHASNFQLAILETRSMNYEDEEIIKREFLGKDILLSSEFGYNDN